MAANRSLKLKPVEGEKMTIQEALDRCLEEIDSGGATVEECLAEFPQFAGELRALLRTARRLETAAPVRPTRAFKAQLRRQLTGENPPRPKRFFGFGVLLVWTIIALLVAGLAVWMGIAFEVAGRYSTPVSPANYRPPSSEIERKAGTELPPASPASFYSRPFVSSHSRASAHAQRLARISRESVPTLEEKTIRPATPAEVKPTNKPFGDKLALRVEDVKR